MNACPHPGPLPQERESTCGLFANPKLRLADAVVHNAEGREYLIMNHLLSIEKLSRADMEKIVAAAGPMKAERGRHSQQPLAGRTWAIIFSKSSTRTRVSFEVAIRELGGSPMFLSANDIQLGRGEPI